MTSTSAAPPIAAKDRAGRWPALPRAPLPEALAICLDLLETDPQSFERAAISWHGRFCGQVQRINIAQAGTALAALDGLRSGDRAAAAERLQMLSRRLGLDEVADTLAGWLADQREWRRLRPPGAPRSNRWTRSRKMRTRTSGLPAADAFKGEHR